MASTQQLGGSTVLITGASSGIGRCFAREFAQRRANLIVTARSTAELNRLADELRRQHSVSVDVIVADLAMPGAARQLVADIQSRRLSVDLLVNNAGFGKWAHFLDEDLETYDHMLSVNVDALSQLTYLLLPRMLEKRSGGVINVASTAAFQPVPYIAMYGATKAFVLNFTEALAAEYRNSGVRFMALCPGNTLTNFAKVANADTTGMSGATPEDVVASALRAFFKGDAYHVPGLGNYLTSLLPRLLPRRMTTAIVAAMFANRVRKAAPA
jgi:uncharacterized protein